MRHLMSPLDLSVQETDKLLNLANDIEKNPEKGFDYRRISICEFSTGQLRPCSQRSCC